MDSDKNQVGNQPPDGHQNKNIHQTSHQAFQPPSRFSSHTLFSMIAIFAVFGGYIILRSFAASPSIIVSKAPSSEELTKLYTTQLVAQASGFADKGQRGSGTQLEKLIDTRKNLVLSLMEKNPAKVLQIGFPEELIKSLPTAATQNIEQRVTIEGTLRIEVSESYNDKSNNFNNFENNFWLVDSSNRRYHIRPVETQNLEKLANAKIRVTGLELEGNLATSGNTIDTQLVTAATTAPLSSRNVAIILTNFKDNTAQPWTTDYIKNIMFGSTGSTVNNFYQEVSYGKLGMTGDVYGYYTISDSSTAGCNYSTWTVSAQAAATAAGVNLSGYDSLIYVWPRTNSCWWAGLADIGGSVIRIDGYPDLRVLSHELGHNLGLHHANSYRCTDTNGQPVSISDTCTNTEYGDPFDDMGNYPKHFSSFFKGLLNFFPSASNIQTVLSSGTYSIAPLEIKSSEVQSLRIPRELDPTTKVPMSYFYLQFSQPYGFDNYALTDPVVNGVSIRYGNANYTPGLHSYLIDNTPTTDSFYDSALAVGKTFTESSRGISVSLRSISTTSATVQVGITQTACLRSNPTVSITPSSQWGKPRSVLTYTVVAKNNDSSTCANTAFTITPTLPKGLSQNVSPQKFTLAPGGSITLSVKITSSSGIAAGYYTFSETIQNTVTTSSKTTVSANYNVFGTGDTVAPSVPQNLSVTVNSLTKPVLNWSPSTDNVGVVGYKIYLNGTYRSSSPDNSFTDINITLSPTNNYKYQVSAIDASGNESALSAYVLVPII